MQSYCSRINMHSYYSIFAYEQYYRPTDIGIFLAKMCKLTTFLYFTLTSVIALSENQEKI